MAIKKPISTVAPSRRGATTSPMTPLAAAPSRKPSDTPMQQQILSGAKKLGLTGIPKTPALPSIAPKAAGTARTGVRRPRTGTA